MQLYEIIKLSELNHWINKCHRDGFTHKLATTYTDGTMKVWKSKILPDELSWKEQRDKYLFQLKTDQNKAKDGLKMGYINKEDLCLAEYVVYSLGEELWTQDEEYYDDLEDLDVSSHKKRIVTIRDKQKTGEWQIQKVRRWQKDFKNNPDGFIIASYNIWDDINVGVWEEPTRGSIDHLLRRLSEQGFMYKTQDLSYEDKKDYADHIFGMFNLGVYEFNKNTKKFTINKDKAIEYIDEHYKRKMISSEVVLELFRKLQILPKTRTYRDWDEYKKKDFIFLTLDENIKRIEKKK